LKKILPIIFLPLIFFLSDRYALKFDSQFVNDSLYNKSFNSYKSGEFFEYKLHYGFLNASYASLELKKEILNDSLVYRATAIGRTTGLARLFYRVDDLYEAFFPLEKVKPLKSIRDIYEGGYVRKAETVYDDKNKTATILNKITNEERVIKLESEYQDIISTFYFLRKHLDITKLKEGDIIFVNIFFASQNYPFKMQYLGIERIKTKFGLIECLKLKPFMEAGRVFRSNEGIDLWVTNDENRIPVKVKANLRVGTIVADLTSFRGITNPFKIIVDD